MAPKVADIRRAGSAALDLAYVAAGRLDGFWEFGLSPWDMAAGALLIQEAGGTVGDFAGNQNYLESGNIVGGNLKIYGAILRTIQPALPESLRR
jgi:myo-inositol-1(or 4)-monophosphatase